MSPLAQTSTSSIEQRTAAIAAALRAVRHHVDPVDELKTEVRRLRERLEHLEDKVELIRDGDETPLAWPVEPEGDKAGMSVPAVTVAKRNSPAFDVLLGPSQ